MTDEHSELKDAWGRLRADLPEDLIHDATVLFHAAKAAGGRQVTDLLPYSSCTSCGVTIYWIQTRRKKKLPLNEDGQPHWKTCPAAEEFRKGK